MNPSTCTLARLLNKGDVIGAGNEFPNWTGSRSTANRNGLLARRLAEKALFLTPTATTLANKPVIIAPVPSLKTVVPATPKTPATTTPAKVTGSPAPAKTPVKTSVKMLGLGGLIGVAYFIFGTD